MNGYLLKEKQIRAYVEKYGSSPLNLNIENNQKYSDRFIGFVYSSQSYAVSIKWLSIIL